MQKSIIAVVSVLAISVLSAQAQAKDFERPNISIGPTIGTSFQ